MYVHYRKTDESDFATPVNEIGLNWIHGTFDTFTLNRPIT